MAGVLNIENLKGKPLFQPDEGLTPEQRALLDGLYLTKSEGVGQISPKLYGTLARFGWEETGRGIPVEALIEAHIDELVESTRTPRWCCGQYSLGPKGLEELQTALINLIISE